jgi:hypothetical protein
MATKIVYTRAKEKKKSIDELKKHNVYLRDTNHADHKGLILHPGTNYNCTGPTEVDFVEDVQKSEANYLRHREGEKGKRTSELWEEGIQNLGVGCYVTPEERITIEKKYIAEVCPDAPARATWHENPETGECDLHILFGVKRPTGTLTLERTHTHLFTKLNQLDKFAADLLNKSKSKPKKRKPHIKTAAEVGAENSAEIAAKSGKSKPMSLPQQIAHLAEMEGIENVEAHHIPGLLERLGIIIKEIINNTIRYFSTRKRLLGKTRVPRVGTIHVEDYLDKILEAQVDIQIAREKSIDEPQLQPQLQEPKLPEPKLPEPQIQKNQPQQAHEAAKKAALLQLYYEAALGRTKVKSSKMTKLANATKGMRSQSGKINNGILKQLTDEQKTILIPLAEALANDLS